MIDRVSLLVATLASVASIAAFSSQFSVWIVQELHKVGDQVGSTEARVIRLEKKLADHMKQEGEHK